MKTQEQAHHDRQLRLLDKLIHRYTVALNEAAMSFQTQESRQIAMYSIQMQINKLQFQYAALRMNEIVTAAIPRAQVDHVQGDSIEQTIHEG